MDIEFDFTERGNISFRNEEGSAVLFAKHGTNGLYIQAAFTPMNYPAWDVSTVTLTDEELQNHIMYNLAGWHIDNSGLEINQDKEQCVLAAEDVIDEIVGHIIDLAEDGDFTPTETTGALDDAISDSASALKYILTEGMKEDCRFLLLEHWEQNNVK